LVKSFQPLPANKAIDLYNALVVARRLQLHPALATVVREIGVTIIDTELHRLVPPEALNHVGALGLRESSSFRSLPSFSTVRHYSGTTECS
jgi:hypothetical protein